MIKSIVIWFQGRPSFDWTIKTCTVAQKHTHRRFFCCVWHFQHINTIFYCQFQKFIPFSQFTLILCVTFGADFYSFGSVHHCVFDKALITHAICLIITLEFYCSLQISSQEMPFNLSLLTQATLHAAMLWIWRGILCFKCHGETHNIPS